MIARLLVTLLLAVFNIAIAAGGEATLAGPLTQETIQAKRNNELSLRNGQWDRLLRDAGNVKRGLVLTARASPSSAILGEPIALRLTLTNVTELPSLTSRVRYGGEVPFVLIRDQHGEPARLSDEGWRRIERLPGKVSAASAEFLPGDAVTDTYPLSTDFVLDKPGKYTVLVAFESRVAGPCEFMLQPRDGRAVGRDRVESEDRILPTPASIAPRTTDPWDALWKLAGTEHNGCTLHGVLSPYSPSAVHLVLSITCVRDMNARTSAFRDHSEGCTINRGTTPWDYRILIRDTNGGAVPMTSFGREFFRRQSDGDRYPVALNCSVGTWLPLDELFSIQPGREYTVLAMIPDNPESVRGLVSSPIKFRAPQFPVAGRTRPFFGSDELWPRLVARSLIRDPNLAIDCRLCDRNSKDPFDADGIPQVTLQKRSGDAFGRELSSAETTVLVRDHRGKPIFPITVEDPDDAFDQQFPGYAEQIKANRRLDTTAFEPLDHRAASVVGSQEVVAFPRFPDRFPIVPGEPYTILVAVRMHGGHPSFVVSPPLAYIPPGYRAGTREPDRGVLHDTIPTSANSSHEDWKSLLRFAGMPFGDLLLLATEGKHGELNLSLINQGKGPVLVKKWEGVAAYDVQIRTADGKPVALSENGKRLFQGGAALDTRDLRPQERLEAAIPIRDLFDMATPGDYRVLASLPVIGEVDAVLTAAPVTVHIGVKSPTATR